MGCGFILWGLVPAARFAGSWQDRGIGVLLAAGGGAGFALLIRSVFRRVVAQPPARRGLADWLARLPAWVSAPLIVCLYMAGPVLLVAGMSWLFHRVTFMSLWGLGYWLIADCGMGGLYPLAWREQRESQARPA